MARTSESWRLLRANVRIRLNIVPEMRIEHGAANGLRCSVDVAGSPPLFGQPTMVGS